MPATYGIAIGGVAKDIEEGWSLSETVNGRSTLTIAVLSMHGTYRPAIGTEAVLTENGSPIFGGFVNTPAEQGFGKGYAIVTRFTAVDYNTYLDRRFVQNGGFPAGFSLESAMDSLVGYLTDYGVVVDPAQVTGPTLPLLVYDVRSLSSIRDELSVITGYIGGINASKQWRMYAVGDIAAPVNIATGDGLVIGDVTVESERENYANRIIVQAGTGTSEVSDPFTGDGTTTVFALTYRLATHRGYVTNGAADEPIGVTAPPYWVHDPVAQTITRSSPPANGNVISITYIAQFPFNAVADAGAAPADLVEKVIQAPETFSADVAQALADGYLARALDVSQTVRYETWQLGLKPGQVQTITIPERNLSGTFLITDVQTTHMGGRWVKRTVTATGGSQYHGSWRDDFKGASGSSGTTVGGTITITTGGGGPGNGTVGSIPKWATTTTLGASLISESGSVITVAGPISATSFSGSGAGLTSLPAGQLTGTITPATQDLITRTGTLVSGATGSGFTLALSMSTITGNLPYVNMPSGIGIWTATPTITGAVTINNQLSVNANITTPAATSLTLNPTGDLMFDPSGQDVLPVTNYTLNLGLPQQKFLTLCAAELIVENLVAADVRSTVGGRIIVAPTTELVQDLAAASTTITTRHNNLSVGDILHLESRGQVEFMTVTAVGGTVTVPWLASGTLSLLFAPVVMITAYTYTVTRNNDGSGANNWIAGDGVVNTRTTGKGFIDLYAASGILNGVGPTIVGNVRTGTTYSNIEPRWAIGNLNGLYGYATDTYGCAFGVQGAAWIKIDPTNGVRIGHNATTNIQLDASGNASFTGTVTAAAGNIGGWTIQPAYIYTGAGTGAGMDPATYPFWSGALYASRSTAPFRVDASGNLFASSATISGTITASSATVSMGSGGVEIAIPPTAFASSYGYKFATGFAGTSFNGLFAQEPVSTTRFLSLQNTTNQAGNTVVTSIVANGSGHGASVQVDALGSVSNASMTADNISIVGAFASSTGTTMIHDGVQLKKLTSSERYKTNVRRGWSPIDAGKLLDIAPMVFDYIDGARDVIGFSAEELAESGLPGLVNYNANGEPESIREHAMLAYLQLEVKRQRARIAVLEGQRQ